MTGYSYKNVIIFELGFECRFFLSDCVSSWSLLTFYFSSGSERTRTMKMIMLMISYSGGCHADLSLTSTFML